MTDDDTTVGVPPFSEIEKEGKEALQNRAGEIARAIYNNPNSVTLDQIAVLGDAGIRDLVEAIRECTRWQMARVRERVSLKYSTINAINESNKTAKENSPTTPTGRAAPQSDAGGAAGEKAKKAVPRPFQKPAPFGAAKPPKRQLWTMKDIKRFMRSATFSAAITRTAIILIIILIIVIFVEILIPVLLSLLTSH